MRRLNCLEVKKGLWRYLDRELPASGIAAVSAHLKRCESCQKLHHERARQANVYRRVLSDAALGPEVSQRIVTAMVREGDLLGSRATPRSGSGRRFGRFDPGRRFLAVAATCLILITTGVCAWLLRAPVVLGEFKAVGGVVWRSSGSGSPVEPFKKGNCLPGNGFTVPEGVELELRLKMLAPRSGATLTLTGPGELTLDETTTVQNFDGRLDSGLLTVRVSRRDPWREPFLIRTPEAMVRVVGTTFVVDATRKGETRLDVFRGEVEFRALNGPLNAARRVTRETGSWLVRSGDPVPVVPAEVTESSNKALQDGAGASAGVTEPEAPAESGVFPPLPPRGGAAANTRVERPPVEASAPRGEISPSASPASGLDAPVNPYAKRDAK